SMPGRSAIRGEELIVTSLGPLDLDHLVGLADEESAARVQQFRSLDRRPLLAIDRHRIEQITVGDTERDAVVDIAGGVVPAPGVDSKFAGALEDAVGLLAR